MNLRVDLILESEQRSASIVSMKSLARIAMIVLPAIAALIVAWGVFGVINNNKDLKNLKMHWAEIEKRQKEAENLQKEIEQYNQILDEFRGWRDSRILWYQEIVNIMKAAEGTPVQLLQLTANDTIEPDVDNRDTPSRMCTFTITGAIADTSDQRAQVVVQKLADRLAASDAIATAEPKRLDEDTRAPKDGKFHGIFDIECVYKPRPFVQ